MPMRSWPVHDAKAKFSQLLEACMRDGPQMVTRRGADAAVMVPIEEWQRLNRLGKPSLKDLLLDDQARGDLNIPARGQHSRRNSGPIV